MLGRLAAGLPGSRTTLMDSADPMAPRGHAGFLALATAAQTATSILQQGIPVVAIFFAQELHLSLFATGVLVAAAMLGAGAGFLLAGMAVDRIGPRRLLFAGSLVIAALAVLVALSYSYPSLLVTLFGLGLVLPTAPSSGQKAVFMAFSGASRGLAMGIRQTGVPLGAAIAAFALPQLALTMGVHRLFFGMAAVVLAVGWAFAAAIPPAPTGVRRARAPVRRRDLWPVALPATLMMLMVSGQYYLLTFTIPFLHRVVGLSVPTAGVILAIGQLGGVAGRVGLGALSDRIGARPQLVLACGGLAMVLATVVAFLRPGSAPAGLAWLWFGFGIGALGWNALLVTWAGERVPAQLAGLAMSLTGMGAFVGSSLYPPLFGWIVDRTGSFSWAWLSLLPIFALASTLNLRSWWKHRPARRPA